MPPRFAYWTILVGGLPTAFRATDREELLPTFKRLQEKHPDAVMRWFSRGALWDSPEAARAAGRPQDGERPARPKDWRPGGEHRDPRQKFIDAKKARNLDWRKKRFERRQQDDGGGRPDAPRDWKPEPPKPDATASAIAKAGRPGRADGSSDRAAAERPEWVEPLACGQTRGPARVEGPAHRTQARRPS